MKYAQIYTLFLMLICHTSCGQNQTNVPQDNTKSNNAGYSESQLKEADTSRVPMSMVRNVKQARDGDILIASYLGVFRYDGTSFTNQTSKIISARIASFLDVLEDRNGNLWFATRDSGVYYYNGKSFQHFTKKDGLAFNMALHIYEDRAGNIWFGVNGGVSRYDGKSFRNYMMNGDSIIEDRTGKTFPDFTRPPNEVTSIIEDKTGKFWFGTRGYTFVFDGKTFTAITYNGKPFKNVRAIIEDTKGNIWLGCNDGLWRYDGSTFTHVSKRGAYAIIQDKKGNIWTAGEVKLYGNVGALSRYDAKSLYDKTPTVTEIKSGGIMDFLCIMEANDGSIWFGSGGGVHRFDGNTVTDFKNKDSH